MNVEARRVIREEAWRSAAWLVLGFLGWSLIVTSTPQIAASTGFLLALLTAVVLTLVTISVRLYTGLELKAETESSQLLTYIGGSAVVGFVFLYLIIVQGRTPWLFVAYLAALVIGGLLWWNTQ